MTDTQAVHAPPNTETEPCGDLCIRTLAMPADTNQNGDIFGGWLLSQMDIGGGVFASKIAKSRTVTVAIEAMNFRKPVFVGDLVSVHANLVRVGQTSITVHLEAWVLRRKEMQSILVTDGNFTYVSIDDQGHPQADQAGRARRFRRNVVMAGLSTAYPVSSEQQAGCGCTGTSPVMTVDFLLEGSRHSARNLLPPAPLFARTEESESDRTMSDTYIIEVSSQAGRHRRPQSGRLSFLRRLPPLQSGWKASCFATHARPSALRCGLQMATCRWSRKQSSHFRAQQGVEPTCVRTLGLKYIWTARCLPRCRLSAGGIASQV